MCNFKIQDLIMGPSEEWMTQVSGLCGGGESASRMTVGAERFAGGPVLPRLSRFVAFLLLPPFIVCWILTWGGLWTGAG